MHTWAGVDQQRKPHLDHYSLLRVRSALQWLREDPAAPWIIRVDQAGLDHPGSWRVLSSNAYLRSVYWFVLLSGGMLQPRVLHLPLQTRGLFCRGHIDQQDDVLPDIITSSEDSLLQSLLSFLWPKQKVKSISRRPGRFLEPASPPPDAPGGPQGAPLSSGTDAPHAQHAPAPAAAAAAAAAAPAAILPPADADAPGPDPAAPARRLSEGDEKESEAVGGEYVGLVKGPGQCKEDIVEDAFLVLWEALAEARTQSTLFVWSKNSSSPQIRFAVLNDALIKVHVSLRDTWSFVVAIVISILAALALACGAVYVCFSNLMPRLRKAHTDAIVMRAASHRLDHELPSALNAAEAGAWNLMVVPVDHPAHGILLRWSTGDCPQPAAWMGVHMKPALAAWADAANDRSRMAECSKEEIYVYLNTSKVTSVHEFGLNQKELFLPSRHPGPVHLEVAQDYELQMHKKYRVRLIFFSAQGRLIDQSRWSAEFILGPRLSITDYPLLLLSKCVPTRVSSLDIFLRKFAKTASHFSIPVELEDLQLHVFAVPCQDPSVYAPGSALGRKRTVSFDHSHSRVLSQLVDSLKQTECRFTVAAHFGQKAHTAREVAMRTGRRVYSDVSFRGRPTLVTPSELREADRQAYAYLTCPGQTFRLDRDRIAQHVIGFEVSDEGTGQVLAFGVIRFEDLYQIVKDAMQDGSSGGAPQDASYPARHSRFRVGLEHVDGRGPWGRLECSLEIKHIKSYIRHEDKEEEQELPGFQRRRARKKTDFQPMGAALAARSVARIRDEPTHETAPARRTRFARVEGNSEDILAQLGLIEEAGRPAAHTPQAAAAAAEAPRPAESSRPTLSRSRRSVVTPIDADSLQIPLLEGSGGGSGAPSSARSPRSSVGLAEARKSRASGLGAKAAAPHFTRDSPGRPVLQGADLFVQWQWGDSPVRPDHIYLALFDHRTDAFVFPLHWGRAIPNTGSYAWHVDTHFRNQETSQLVYLGMFESEVDPCTPASEAVCQSNAFFIVKPTPLCELELLYACFCRTHGLEMEHLSEAKLVEFGFSVQETMLKVCPDLRAPFSTEPPAEAVHCPGQCVVSTQSKLVMLAKTDEETFNQAAHVQEKQVVVYKSVSRLVRIIENIEISQDVKWWTQSPDVSLLNMGLCYNNVVMEKALRLLGKAIRRARGVGRLSRRRWDSLLTDLPRFMSSRTAEFVVLPNLVNFLLVCLQLAIGYGFPVLLVSLYLYDCHSLAKVDSDSADDNTVSLLPDIAFDVSWKTLSNLGPWGVSIFCLAGLHFLVMTVAIFFNAFLRDEQPRLMLHVDVLGSIFLTVSLFSVTLGVSSFILWFLLGALVNSDSFLPYAAMFGSVTFVIYFLWSNFVTSRESVSRYIEENMQLLLSLALDHWFAHTNITYTGKEQLVADETLIAYRDKIRDELRLATYVYEKVVAPFENAFSIDSNGVATGLHAIPNLPDGARFATCAEVERHSERVEDMLTGWDSVLLKDGVKYGPRYGYKVDTSPAPNTSYSQAIIAVPKYPPAEELDEMLKVQLIFDKFVDDHKDKLTAKNYLALLRRVKGSDTELTQWEQLCEYYNDAVNTNIDPAVGISLHDLVKIYSLQSGDLDRDYELLFPTLRPGEADDLDMEELDRLSDESLELSASEPSDIDETTDEEDEDMPNLLNEAIAGFAAAREGPANVAVAFIAAAAAGDAVAAAPAAGLAAAAQVAAAAAAAEARCLLLGRLWAPQEADDEGRDRNAIANTEEDRIEYELKSKINARKLQFIYNYVTQENRGQAVDELISSVPYLAAKTLETHLLLLSPVFGKEAVLGTSAPSLRLARAGSALSAGYAGLGSEEAPGARKEDRFVTLLKVIQVEFYQELTRQFRLVHAQMFDTLNVRSGIQDYFDNVMPQKVSMKASRLLNSSLELSRADVHPSNQEALTSAPPKTANQLMRSLQRYRIEKDFEIRDILALIAKAQGSQQQQLQVHLIMKTLVDLQIIEPRQVQEEDLELIVEGAAIREMKILQPTELACLKLVVEAIDKQLGGRLQRMNSTTHVVQVLKYISERYLWLPCFQFLVQLLGNNLSVDELPGGAVEMDGVSDRDSEKVSEDRGSRLMSSAEDRQRRRYESNLERLRSVFHQLGNWSGFLPLDLVDEAIQLLTDNRLNFSGVVGCLQQLKIGSVYVHERGHAVGALEKLGLRKDSAVCDIQASSETVSEIIDWTQFRHDPGWTPEMFRAFEKLTASCPGYMGKSQMVEFVKEIHKLFQPQISELRRGRDRLRGRKAGPKEGITQLGTVNRDVAMRAAEGDDFQAVPGDLALDAMEEGMRMVSFEMFHRVAVKLGLSVGHRHSRMLWIMISFDSYDEIQQFLPERDVKLGITRVYLQPFTALGKPFLNRDSVSNIVGYKGLVTFVIFRRILRQLDIVISDRAARALWDELPKDPMDVTDFLPAGLLEGSIRTKYLRLEMDTLGMDPTKGRVVSIECLRKKLPRLLMTGLWPEAIRVLLTLALQLEVPNSRLERVLKSMERRTNRFGLIKPEDVGSILSSLSVEGMSFAMLRDVIHKMRIQMPEQDIKRMFDLMDINHDLSLSLSELLSGFEVLFGRFMPLLVLQEVGLSLDRMLLVLCLTTLGLLAFFGFLGLAFSSFESLKSGVSTAVQSMLAVLGAVGLQSGASQEAEEVEQKMKQHIESIMGDKLSRAKEQVEELQEAYKPEPTSKEGKPLKLRYIVPRRYRPDLEDPRPCVTFAPGSYVRLEPAVSGRVDRTQLRWSITPRLPPQTGLVFSRQTGIIEGIIPAKDEGDMSAQLMHAFTKSHDPASRVYQPTAEAAAAYHADEASDVVRPLRVPRKTYVIVCRNQAGSARARVTFQIQPKAQATRTHAKKDEEGKREVRKRQSLRDQSSAN
ncbi:EF hand domain-containing protein, putative [Eimeria tenella]|uniref:EF hand domain-containing protein, putative n=1 Tax=Eimeria tenella TaxID=5802 RepID=U6KJ05_EIMTE|nr:EF hand domain-containing protein, putative [Eimeria tenella]CDJ37889.1 EF hand domain-containing protein, putative [Eimeria tenella]|eukprot:XP_013228727.1 EF hand domain-containing protein, putative [Eimeria tenella]